MNTELNFAKTSLRPEQLVLRLDHCQVVVEPGRVWTIHVLGFHVLNGEAWLQLRLVGRPSHGVVVHLSAPASANDVLNGLRAWLGSPGNDRVRTVEVLAVM